MKKITFKLIALKMLAITILLMPVANCQSGDADTIPDDDLGIRKGTLLTEEVVVPETATVHTEAGESDKHDRSFENAPPMIPHDISDFVPITIQTNECVECHNPEVAEDAGATSVPASHYYDLREDKKLSELSGANYNCTLCHYTMADIPPIVENEFNPEFRNSEDQHSSDLLDKLNEGVK